MKFNRELQVKPHDQLCDHKHEPGVFSSSSQFEINMFKPTEFIAIILFLIPVGTLAGDLEDLLARNAIAHGGPENWARIENVRYLLTINEPSFEVTGTYVATRDGSMRIDIEADGNRVFSEGLHDGQAWQWTTGEGITLQDDQSAAALRHGIELPGRFFTLQDLHQSGEKVTLEGAVYEQDQRQWQVRVILEDGFSHDYYIDDSSAQIIRERDYRAFHPGVDSTRVTVETRKQEPLWVDGILSYSVNKNVNVDSGEWLATTRVRSIEHNIVIPKDYFLPD